DPARPPISLAMDRHEGCQAIRSPSHPERIKGLRTNAKYFQSAAVLLIVAIVVLRAVVGAAESEIDHLVQILELARGSTVADVGAGSGEISVAMAPSLGPEGKVYSTEIEAKLL